MIILNFTIIGERKKTHLTDLKSLFHWPSTITLPFIILQYHRTLKKQIAEAQMGGIINV